MRETMGVLFDAAGTLFDLAPDLPTRLADALRGRVPDPGAAVRGALSRVNDRGGWPEDQPDRPRRLAVWTEFVRALLADAIPADAGAGADAEIGAGARQRAFTAEAAAIAADIVDPRAYELFPEVRGVLDRFVQAGVGCAVVSNFDGLLVEILDHLDIRRYFVTVAYSGEIGVYKPDPRIFARALDPLGVDVEYAVMVGDSPYSDIGGGAAFGLRTVLVDRDHRCPESEGEVVASLAELPALLLGAGAERRPA